VPGKGERREEGSTKKLGAKDTLDESETLRADEAARIAAQLGSARLYGLDLVFWSRRRVGYIAVLISVPQF